MRERCAGGRDGGVDVIARGKGDARDDRPVGGVVDVNERVVAGNESAADVVLHFRIFHAHTIEEGLLFKLLSKPESGK